VKISIIVPAFNEEKLLPASLRAMNESREAFHQRGWETELIVCDNNSTDRTAEVAKAEGAHVVFEPINQIARARNSGAAAAKGDWILFIDADSQPSHALFDDVADAITTGKYIAGGVTVRLDGWFPGMSLFVAMWNVTSRIKKWCAGSFIFCEAVAFRAIGGFSKELFVSEELDLSQRLGVHGKTQGKRMVILRRHPLVTSSRKVRLYGHGAHLKFLWKLIIGRGRVLRQREECTIWYDGRR
jgi:glycosyltransferase involved in cell wall biosynthesis